MSLLLSELALSLSKLQREKIPAHKNPLQKKKLHELTKFFLEKSWTMIDHDLSAKPQCGLLTETPGNIPLTEYLQSLSERNQCFPWAWFRARTTDAITTSLEAMLPGILTTHQDKANAYKKSLLANGRYWFRQTPFLQLKLGYHTAQSAFWKIFGEAARLTSPEKHREYFQHPDSLGELLKIVASFHLEMLLSTDGVFWDASGATTIPDVVMENNSLCTHRDILSNITARFPVTPKNLQEPRLGCPALTAKFNNSTVFEAVYSWNLKIFQELFLPLLISKK